MRPPLPLAKPLLGHICDRCSRPYLTARFPSELLCPSCFIGVMHPTDQARVLGHLEITGRRISA